MSFAQVRQDYERLAAQLKQRQIERAAFTAAMAALRTQDPQGRWWTIDANTGGWLVWQNNAWTPGEPPVAAPPKPPPPPAPPRPPTPIAGPTAPPPRAASPPPATPRPPQRPPTPPPVAPRPAAPPPRPSPIITQAPAEDDLPPLPPEELPEPTAPSPAAAGPEPEPAAEQPTAEPEPEPMADETPLAPEAAVKETAPPPEELDPLEQILRCLEPDAHVSQAEALALLLALRGDQAPRASGPTSAQLGAGLAMLRQALRAAPLVEPGGKQGQVAPAYLPQALAALAELDETAAPEPCAPSLGDPWAAGALPQRALVQLAHLAALGVAPAEARIAPHGAIEGPIAALTAQAQRQMSADQALETASAGRYGDWLRELAEGNEPMALPQDEAARQAELEASTDALWGAADAAAEAPPLCLAGELAAEALARLAEDLIRALNAADAAGDVPRAAWFR